MAHAELTRTIYRSTLQPSQKGTQSVKVAIWSKVTSGKTQWWGIKDVQPFHTQAMNMFQRFRNGLPHAKRHLREVTESIKNSVKWTEVCFQNMSLSCERMIYIYIGDYCTTPYANTLNDHVEQRWDVWGHFRVITTVRHLCSSWTQRSQCTITSTVQRSQHTEKHVQYLQNDFIDTVD